MPTFLDWNPQLDPDAVVRQVCEALEQGQIVALPSRSGYVGLLNPTGPKSSRQFEALRNFGGSVPAVLSFGPEEPAQLGLSLPPIAGRLVYRAWPGPLVLALPTDQSLPVDWPEAMKAEAARAGSIRFRAPDHALFDGLLSTLKNLALVVDTHQTDPAAVAAALGDELGLMVSVPDRKHSARPTVVLVEANSWSILEEGSIARSDVEKLSARLILFVCTGNTCRSPMAEAMAKRLLADRLKCQVDELPGRGYWLMSAGVAAYGDAPASPLAADAAAEFGADLTRHRSRPVNPQLLSAADVVVAMTEGHAAALAGRYAGFGPPARLLCEDGDLPDPIGSDLEVYRACARTIHHHLQRLISEWEGP